MLAALLVSSPHCRWSWVRALSTLLAGALWALAPRAQAQSSGERALAEALFQEGRELMLRNKHKLACAKFEESQRLEVALGTLLNLAACYEAADKTASAWAEYARALALAERVGDLERKAFAEQQQARLNARLSRLTLRTDQPREGLRIAIDGKQVRAGAWDTPLPLDPGVHWLRVSAPGRSAWERRIVVPEGPSAVTLQVPALEAHAEPTNAQAADAAPVDAPSGAKSVGLQGNDAVELSAEPTTNAQAVWTWATLGTSAAALATGTVAAVRFNEHRAIIRDHCRGQYCDARGLEADRRARASALVADVSFGVGALLLLVTGYLWYTAPAAPTPNVALRPSVTTNGVLLNASGHY